MTVSKGGFCDLRADLGTSREYLVKEPSQKSVEKRKKPPLPLSFHGASHDLTRIEKTWKRARSFR